MGGGDSRRVISFIFKREDESLLTTWPTRLWAFPLATLCFHRLARTTFILFSAVPRRWEPPTCKPILWSNFVRKKETREWPHRPLRGCSQIHLDTRPLPETSTAQLFLCETEAYNILSRVAVVSLENASPSQVTVFRHAIFSLWPFKKILQLS